MLNFLQYLFGPKKLDFSPVPGQKSSHADGFYQDPDNNLWETFEGIWVNS